MEALEILRKSFKSGITRNLAFRKKQLVALFTMLEEHENDFIEVLYKDLHKSAAEAKLSELLLCKQEISYILKNMDNWLANEKVPKTFLTLTDSTWIQRQPFGVALSIGTWNYPVQLNLIPLIGLLAAGNCVILKPSEIAVNTEKLLFELIPKYVDQSVCRVELGDAKRTGELLKLKFDYIVFTGNSGVAKIVLEAAAKHLTPVLLELGGKSPTYVDKDVVMKMAARRIITSKFMNVGQTCIAPDYVLCHKAVKEPFLCAAIEAIEEFYSADASGSQDYPRIISNNHYHRVMDMIKQTRGKVAYGGVGKEDQLYIAPTIVILDSVEDILMKSEIFGPVMPILIVNSEDEAIEIINNGEKPLAEYVFSNDRAVLNKFELETTSGSLVFNDCVVHCAVKGLPFGGVGKSGMGAYHGKFSIDSFSHKRGVLDKDTKDIVNNLLRYPPYNKKKESWADWALKSDSKDSSGFCSIL